MPGARLPLLLAVLLIATPASANPRLLDDNGIIRTHSGFALDAAGRPALRPNPTFQEAGAGERISGSAGADGRWVEIGTPVRLVPSVVADDAHHRLVLFGGARMGDNHGYPYMNDVWTLDTSTLSRWQRLEVTGDRPAARAGNGFAYDSARHRLIVYGGFSFEILPDNSFATHYYDDAWELSLDGIPHWTLLAASGPGPRTTPAGAYDPVHDRFVIAGGFYFDESMDYDGEYKADVWSLSLGSGGGWTEITPKEEGPGPRSFALLGYDAPNDRFVTFGGDHAGGIHGVETLQDVWTLDRDGWAPVPTGEVTPPLRTQGVSAWDPTRRQVHLLGGWFSDEYFGDFIADRWTFDLASASWRQSSTGPTGREYAMAVVAPGADALYFGFGDRGFVGLTDTWRVSLPGGDWTEITPPIEFFNSASYGFDRAGRRVVVFGGDAPQEKDFPVPGPYYIDAVRAWNVDDGSWTSIPIEGPGPTGRTRAASAFDTKRRRLWVVGGDNHYYGLPETWALELEGTPRWWKVPDGPHPSAERYGLPTAVYDSIDDRVLYFGGTLDAGRNEVWSLSPEGAWSQLDVAGAVPYPFSANAVFDSKRHRVLAFGGHEAGTPDLWSLDLDGSPSWHAIAAEGPSPLPRTDGRAVYDPRHDRVLLFGGSNPQDFDPDTYELSLSGTPAWRRLDSGQPAAQPRRGHILVFDEARDRMLLTSGEESFLSFTDGWALQFEPTDIKVALELERSNLSTHSRGPVPLAILSLPGFDPATVDVASLLFDGARGQPSRKPAGDRNGDGVPDLVVDFEGGDMARSERTLHLTGSLRDGTHIFGSVDADLRPSARLHVAEARLALASRVGSRGCSIDLSLPAEGSWRFELYDVRGRRILERSGVASGPGTIPVTLDFDGPSGIYFARLRQDAGVATGRLAWTR